MFAFGWGEDVAPLAGAWIETLALLLAGCSGYNVAPLAGAWIETLHTRFLPLPKYVAPLAGAWIET